MEPTERTQHIEQLRSQLDSRGLTEHGRDWVMKALYPPGTNPPTPPPDESYLPSVTLEYRQVVALEAPSGLADGQTWDMCIVSMPGDNVAAVVARGPRNTNFQAPASALEVNFIANQEVGTQTSLTRTVLGGTVQQSQVMVGLDPVATVAFRTAAKSLTLHCTSAAIDNGGVLTVGQLPMVWEASHAAMVAADRGAAPPDSLAVMAPWTGMLPLSEQSLVRMAPGSETWEAKEGAYVPVRLGPNGGELVWRPAASGRCGLTAGVNTTANVSFLSDLPQPTSISTLPSCALQASSLATSVTSSWFSSSKLPEASYLAQPFADDNAYDRASTVVMILRGLAKTASFSLTTRTVVQRVVGSGSTLSAVVKPPPEPDLRALEAYYAIAAHMKYVYPARFNSVAAVLPLVGQALKVIGPHLLPVAAEAAKMVVRKLGGPSPKQLTPPPFRPATAKAAKPKPKPKPSKPKPKKRHL